MRLALIFLALTGPALASDPCDILTLRPGYCVGQQMERDRWMREMDRDD